MEVTIYLLSGMIQVKWLCDPLICICTYAMTDPWDFCICTYWFTIGHPNLWKSYPFASAFITSIIWLVFESRNAIQVFESSQISTCLSLCYSKNACFLLGKHPWCFKVGGPDDFLYLRISPAWTSHKSLRIFMQMWSPQIAESAKRFSRCTKATTTKHPPWIVGLPSSET